MDRFVKGKMQDYKEKAIDSLIEVLNLGNTSHNDKIAKTLAYAWFDRFEPAIDIIEKANLYPIEIHAILDNEDEFYELWLKEESDRIGEMLYDAAQGY